MDHDEERDWGGVVMFVGLVLMGASAVLFPILLAVAVFCR